MKHPYRAFLQTLSKEQLVARLYTPFRSAKAPPARSERTVALRVSYDGLPFKGVQPHGDALSIAGAVENALALTHIGCGQAPVFSGRTDAGVSAIAMVVSVTVISALAEPNRSFKPAPSDAQEYPYDVLLNERLPPAIRVTGWAPVPDDFNARYMCTQRHYRYFFIPNNIDIARMRSAAARVAAMTDFYDLSTHSDPDAKYTRNIDELRISLVNPATMEPIPEESPDNSLASPSVGFAADNVLEGRASGATRPSLRHSGFDKECLLVSAAACAAAQELPLYCIDIKARAFLHNMVRKIVSVLKACGRGEAFSLKFVPIADAFPLVFVAAQYPTPLHFYSNRYCAIQFAKDENEMRIRHAVARARVYLTRAADE